MLSSPDKHSTTSVSKPSNGMSRGVKLLIGAGGIYASFLTLGKLHEQIFKGYKSEDGEKFTFAFFLQAVEAIANVVFAGIALRIMGHQKGLPIKNFVTTGVAQVLAKACTSLALANGLSFPVVSLAKSGKMVPVMLGSMVLGGKTYRVKEYLMVAAILTGTAIVTIDQRNSGKDKEDSGKDKEDSMWGMIFVTASLALDAVVGGLQTGIKKETKEKLGTEPAPFDFMFWTNLFMACAAGIIVLLPFNASLEVVQPELVRALAYCMKNPIITVKIALFSMCSAVGQAFIFFSIANFDPLTATTITTTRKIFSTLLSIFTENHSLSSLGWVGVASATVGISMDVIEKVVEPKKPKEAKV